MEELLGNILFGLLGWLWNSLTSKGKAAELEGEVQQQAADTRTAQPQGTDEMAKADNADIWEEYRKKQDALSARQKE